MKRILVKLFLLSALVGVYAYADDIEVVATKNTCDAGNGNVCTCATACWAGNGQCGCV